MPLIVVRNQFLTMSLIKILRKDALQKITSNMLTSDIIEGATADHARNMSAIKDILI